MLKVIFGRSRLTCDTRVIDFDYALEQLYHDRLSNRPEFSGTVPIFGAMSRIPNFHLIVPNFLRKPVTEIGPPKKVTECLQNFQSIAIHLKYLVLVSY